MSLSRRSPWRERRRPQCICGSASNAERKRAPKFQERSAPAIDFVRWSAENGRPQAETLNYVPLPTALIDQIERYWQQSIGAAPTVSASASVER